MASTFLSVHLADRPNPDIIPGKTFKIQTNPTPKASDLKEGQVIFKSLYLSLDPAMRGWLSSKFNVGSYVPPVKIGETMRGVCVGVIEASKSKSYPVGSYANSMVGWTELAVVDEKHLEKIDLPKNARATDALGVLGMTGLTAYFGMLDVGKVKAGDFVVVSGAAGATGSVAGQIAKLKGAKVLGIAGGQEKVRWLKEELGFDDALDYKDKDFAAKFRTATKDLIDLFYDNVGGEVLNLALSRAKPHARFVMCGGISQYNSAKPEGPSARLPIQDRPFEPMEGFIVFDYKSQYPAALTELAQWLVEGKIRRKDTIIKGGLKKAEYALVDLYKGVNTGKLLLEVSPEGGNTKAKL
ncbi:putative nadp-dependent leukotriene b4 12-hydroxydehydrogenase [Phaeomoniella chlamydospora]|uniref:Putative nadp-dependent leukotriene b4 12-hydroxydehydrogenase n=1 Tax=Phaeomoniella chlamydospora TaxID=158046 RepID=A0A0G2FZN8_PHACM|nr:putative nadp-dependent leukotriene b4 12-hydroxydehydrogenase [Phaeomoniella chlamydospora]